MTSLNVMRGLDSLPSDRVVSLSQSGSKLIVHTIDKVFEST